MKFFSEIKQFWIDTWLESKLLFCVELTCTLMGMTAATMLNFGAKEPNMLVVLVLYTVGAVGLTLTSYYRKTPMMVMLMGYYVIVGLIGISTLLQG